MEQTEQPILEVSGLRVRLNHHTILDGVRFHAHRNETVAVIGPNGAGKTVLFRAILGLLPHEGTVKWKDGVRIGYVPQKLSIGADLPLTTLEFFQLKSSDAHAVEQALDAVGFTKKLVGNFHEILKQRLGFLSGGQLQRVLIAWALLDKPDVLLFDEPTSGVDVSTEGTIYNVLHRLQEENGILLIFISHELEIVSKYADNVICLNKKMFCFGTPRHALSQKTLEDMFGKDMNVYIHHDH